MKKVLLLLATGLVLVCVIAAAGCTANTWSSTTTTTTTTDTNGNVHTETHSTSTENGQTTSSTIVSNLKQEVLGTWYTLYSDGTRYVALTVKDDGTAEAEIYEIVNGGENKLLKTVKASFTLSDDGTYKLTEIGGSEVSEFKLGDDGKTLVCVKSNGVADPANLFTYHRTAEEAGLSKKA